MNTMYFAHIHGLYRYWVRPAAGNTIGNIKLQVKRKLIQAFRDSHRNLEHAVDILEVGGGWYHISSRETKLDGLFGTTSNGAAAWLRAFNLSNLATTHANPEYPVVYVRRLVHPRLPQPDLGRLLDKYVRKPTHQKAPGSNFHPRNK